MRSVRLQPDRGVRWQLALAAALFLCALLLRSATTTIDRRIVSNFTSPAPAANQQVLDALASALGDDVNARVAVEAMLQRDVEPVPAEVQGIPQ